jgi:trk/ktr system potassium uptake protein
MFVVVAGGGKIGVSVTRTLLALGHELVLVEQEEARYDRLEEEFQHRAILGDATEMFVLEQAGLGRPPDIVVAVTGDDEDNIVICQLAREKFGVPKVIARVNDPRNESHFDLLGISPTVSATSMVLALVEHEVPQHELVHLLQLRKENLEIVEVEIKENSAAAGKRVEDLHLPHTARLVSVLREGRAEIAVGSTELHAGDQVLAILEPGSEDDLKSVLLASGLPL